MVRSRLPANPTRCYSNNSKMPKRTEKLPVGGLQLQVAQKWTKTKRVLIDAFVASPPEPLRLAKSKHLTARASFSEFQTHNRTRLDQARAVRCLDLANSSPSMAGGVHAKRSITVDSRAKTSIERCVNATDHRCELCGCLWPHGAVCHSPQPIPAPRSHGKPRIRLRATGQG